MNSQETMYNKTKVEGKNQLKSIRAEMFFFFCFPPTLIKLNDSNKNVGRPISASYLRPTFSNQTERK
jgi:hypothetical protein